VARVESWVSRRMQLMAWAQHMAWWRSMKYTMKKS
jgi:hypothetical protein